MNGTKEEQMHEAIREARVPSGAAIQNVDRESLMVRGVAGSRKHPILYHNGLGHTLELWVEDSDLVFTVTEPAP